MRQNGWDRPFDSLQIITWVIFPFLVGGYYAFTVPFLPGSLVIVLCSVLYGFLTLSVLYMAWKCATINPVDDSILRPSDDVMAAEVERDSIYCNVCMQYVHKDSRHCRVCDKCVARFDHHCKWLNSCVGKKNYSHFFATIIFTFLLTATQLGAGIYLVVFLFSDSEAADKRVFEAYGCRDNELDEIRGCAQGKFRFPRIALICIQVGFVAVLLPTIYLIAQLIIFHMRLSFENITTYDYIVRARKRRLDRMRNLASGGTNSYTNVDSEVALWRVLCWRKKKDAEPSGDASDDEGIGMDNNSTNEVSGSLQISTAAPPPTRGFGKLLIPRNESERNGSTVYNSVNTPQARGQNRNS